jgi:phospholipase C
MKRLLIPLLVLLLACSSLTTELPTATVAPDSPTPVPATLTPLPSFTPLPRPSFTPAPTQTPIPSLTPMSSVPAFAHIVVLVFENKEYGSVIGNKTAPYFNTLAQNNTLLTAFYAVSHPSLPNYLAMIGGDTFGVSSDCIKCFVDAPSLPDLLEKAGLTWRTYQERMPSPCFVGDTLLYNQKHNPFIYFTLIRQDADRCQRDIVPFTQLETDLAANDLANFVFITPDLCNDAHDCPVSSADVWLQAKLPPLLEYLDGTSQPYLVVLTWDEGQGDHSCCGLPELAGGRIPVVLISRQAKTGFQDDTPYTHYSLLKTISATWHLPYLGHAADAENVLITAPWK